MGLPSYLPSYVKQQIGDNPVKESWLMYVYKGSIKIKKGVMVDKVFYRLDGGSQVQLPSEPLTVEYNKIWVTEEKDLLYALTLMKECWWEIYRRQKIRKEQADERCGCYEAIASRNSEGGDVCRTVER